jgi:UDP-N-acetylglucosamine--N-acetylmuramyl-(pentapeptide) pyrophosphoryl-undecaprenol N-acetylglucosamine transferase
MNILLTGGGTAGSVSPLIAIYKFLSKKQPDLSVLFVGTRHGIPEKEMTESAGMTYASIFSGKFRRYFDLRNFFDQILILIGFIQSFFVITKFKPDIIIGAGGFVSVPVIWAGWVLKKKIIIHQQDLKPSLSNILTMNLADAITTTFEESARFFPKKKVHWIGNPSRAELNDFHAPVGFELDETMPIVVIVGGGTGSSFLNDFVKDNLDSLTEKFQIILITGKNKGALTNAKKNYLSFEFLDDRILSVFKKATVVVSRAGLSTLTELSYLSKPSILVPLPNTHQVVNAKYFFNHHASEYHDQVNDSAQHLLRQIDSLATDRAKQSALAANIGSLMKKNACSDMITLVLTLTGHGSN